MSTQISLGAVVFALVFVPTSGSLGQSIRIEGQARPYTPEDFVAKLSQIVHVEKQFEGPLENVVRPLADLLSVTILYDDIAFKNADPPLDNVQTGTARLPVMKNVRVETIFRTLLDPLGGTLLIRGDHLYITTIKVAIQQSESGSLRPRFLEDDDEPFVPLCMSWHSPLIVHCTFDHKSLRDVVSTLAARYPEYRIELSTRVGLRDRTPINGTLINLPVNDVCQRIAEAAGLEAVDTPNGALITTHVHAADVRQQEEVRYRQLLQARYATFAPQRSLFQASQPNSRPKAVDWDDYSRRIRNRQTPPANGE